VYRWHQARSSRARWIHVPVWIGLALLAAAAIAEAAPPGEAPDLDALRRQAAARLDALAAGLPPTLKPTPELARAYIEGYIELRTRTIEPCPSLNAAAHDDEPGAAHTTLLLGGPPPLVRAVPDSDTVLTWGKVFLDLDADSTYDEGEPGLEDVVVSKGTRAYPDYFLGPGVKLTAPDGTFSFLTPLPDSRFIFVTVPSGYTATTPFFHRLTGASPDTAYFGLIETPETANPVFRWVQISDMQVNALATSGDELSADLTEIGALPEPPAFMIITGDLVDTGAITAQYDVFLNGIAGHQIPIRPGYGDHDANAPSLLKVDNFEQYIGPTCYSFDYGGVHFILYNDIHAVDLAGQFLQYDWLFADLTIAHGRNQPIVVCKHMMPLSNELSLYDQLGVNAAFSGHWHGSRVRYLLDIFDINTPPIRYAGIDKSSRGFRINDMNNGAIQTTYRLAGLDDHIHVALPAAGDSVIAGPVAVRVNAYDSVDRILSGEFSVAGPLAAGPFPLAADGPWAWKTIWDAAAAPDGEYTLTATLAHEVGGPIAAEATFTLVRASVEAPDPYTDWPCFKHDPAGNGFTPLDLPPPLRVQWVKHLGGRNNVESPAVAGGRVYVGTSNISTVNEAALNCFDAVTGNLLWRFPAGTDVKSTPAVADGRVYFTTSIGKLFALDAATGSLLWRAQLGDSLTRWEMTSPTVFAGKVYAGGIPAMSCYNAATGDSLWRYVGHTGPDADFIPSVYSAPAVSGETVVFTTRGGIFAFDRNTGALRWQVSGQHRSAAIVNDLVYTEGRAFGSQKIKAYALLTGQLVYESTYSQGESTAGPVVSANRILAVHGGNADGGVPRGKVESWLPTLGTELVAELYVGDPITSSRPYQRITASINSTPAVAGNVAYFGADDGRLHAMDVTTGAELWSHNLGIPVRSSPAIAGNMLFLTAEDGSLYAFVATTLSTTGTGPGGAAPLATRLLGARPNPFNPATAIAFDVGPAGTHLQPVSLRIYDAAGRFVRTLVDSPLAPGHHVARWDGRNDAADPAASGVYFCRLEAGGETFESRLVLLK
jgi:outer membrane protein assembly factor BamB